MKNQVRLMLSILLLVQGAHCASGRLRDSKSVDSNEMNFTILETYETWSHGWGKYSWQIKPEFRETRAYFVVKTQARNTGKTPQVVGFQRSTIDLVSADGQTKTYQCTHIETPYPAIFELFIGYDYVRNPVIKPADEVVRVTYYLIDKGMRPKQIRLGGIEDFLIPLE